MELHTSCRKVRNFVDLYEHSPFNFIALIFLNRSHCSTKARRVGIQTRPKRGIASAAIKVRPTRQGHRRVRRDSVVLSAAMSAIASVCRAGERGRAAVLLVTVTGA